MAEAYEEFLNHDWANDEGWQAYLEGLYPRPQGKQQLKFQKKWYKRNVDSNFDDSYEPPRPAPSAAGPQSSETSRASASSSVPPSSLPSASFRDGTRWSIMGAKARICFGAYALAMVMAVGGMAAAFPAYQALLLLVGAFILEILAKYGVKLKSEWLHGVLLDDISAMPIMSLTVLMPGLDRTLRISALVPPFLTALLSFSQICKYHAGLPAAVRDFFAPLAEPGARFKVMRVRAHLEVAVGFLLIGFIFLGRAAPFSVVMFWNFMMMRYMMSSRTQESFAAVNGFLEPRLAKIPGVKFAYAALKDKLYSFVDPQSKRAGHLCTIL